ncbi:MAG: hypothetical protein P8X39_13030, partial [Desulfofustis sp.]
VDMSRIKLTCATKSFSEKTIFQGCLYLELPVQRKTQLELPSRTTACQEKPGCVFIHKTRKRQAQG